MGKKVKKENDALCKDTFEPVPIESKQPATVVLMLSSPEEDVLIKACDAIYTFAEKGDENKVCLLGLGALEPLCELLAHQDKLVRRNAVMALGVMATNGDVTSALKKLDVIPSIIDKVSLEEDTVVQEFATLCLASLSVDFDCKVKIFDSKGLPPLIHLLSSPDPDVKKNTVETIFNMVQDQAIGQGLRELDGISPLLTMVTSEYPDIQRLALNTLEVLTAQRDARAVFTHQRGFEKLMDFLNTKDVSDLHAEALRVLCNCLEDSQSLRLVHEVGGVSALMHFVLSPSTAPEVRSNAVTCIARTAQSSENRRLLHEQGVERPLVELLGGDGDGVKMAACRAVAAMSLHLSSKDTFRDLGCVPAVVRLLGSDRVEVREAAGHALSNLTHNHQPNATAVHEADGVKALVRLLGDGGSSSPSSPGSVVHAAAALANMAEQEVLRGHILLHAAVQALAWPLQSRNTDVLVPVTQCLAILASSAEARAQLRSAGAVPPLVNLLRSSHTEVRCNACWAISVCANDEPTAVEMWKHGALEWLQEINQSATRRNRFSQAALLRLLNSNLSVKYSLTGRLAYTDITADGFYDAGQVRVGQKVRTLEELSKQPVNQWRPVIFVNAAAEVHVDPEEARPESPPSTRSKTPSRARSRGRRDEDKRKEESNVVKQPEEEEEASTEKPWTLPFDPSFQALCAQATASILPLGDQSDMCAALARLVGEAMGGAVEVESWQEFSWELHLSQLKVELRSNVIPIGGICKGIYCHRALLFKCLSDRIGLSCTLVRGEYNRAWNEVFLPEGTPQLPHLPGHRTPLTAYIVDLMHQPGRLLKSNTAAAMQYQTI